MRHRLFTDFDGPLMDVSERYYQVYLYCLEQIKQPRQAVVSLNKGEFWRLKRARVPEREIAYRSGLILQGQDRDFAELRGEVVHSKPFFPFDCLHDWAVPTLDLARRSGIELAIMTMRRQSELLPVLEQYGLVRFFPANLCFCLRDDYPKTYDTQDKPRLMLEAVARLPFVDRHWIVGDTEADIIAGKRFNCTTIGVLSGIRNRSQLQLHHPDYIVQDLVAAVQLVLKS